MAPEAKGVRWKSPRKPRRNPKKNPEKKSEKKFLGFAAVVCNRSVKFDENTILKSWEGPNILIFDDDLNSPDFNVAVDMTSKHGIPKKGTSLLATEFAKKQSKPSFYWWIIRLTLFMFFFLSVLFFFWPKSRHACTITTYYHHNFLFMLTLCWLSMNSISNLFEINVSNRVCIQE